MGTTATNTAGLMAAGLVSAGPVGKTMQPGGVGVAVAVAAGGNTPTPTDAPKSASASPSPGFVASGLAGKSVPGAVGSVQGAAAGRLPLYAGGQMTQAMYQQQVLLQNQVCLLSILPSLCLSVSLNLNLCSLSPSSRSLYLSSSRFSFPLSTSMSLFVPVYLRFLFVSVSMSASAGPSPGLIAPGLAGKSVPGAVGAGQGAAAARFPLYGGGQMTQAMYQQQVLLQNQVCVSSPLLPLPVLLCFFISVSLALSLSVGSFSLSSSLFSSPRGADAGHVPSSGALAEPDLCLYLLSPPSTVSLSPFTPVSLRCLLSLSLRPCLKFASASRNPLLPHPVPCLFLCLPSLPQSPQLRLALRQQPQQQWLAGTTILPGAGGGGGYRCQALVRVSFLANTFPSQHPQQRLALQQQQQQQQQLAAGLLSTTTTPASGMATTTTTTPGHPPQPGQIQTQMLHPLLSVHALFRASFFANTFPSQHPQQRLALQQQQQQQQLAAGRLTTTTTPVAGMATTTTTTTTPGHPPQPGQMPMPMQMMPNGTTAMAAAAAAAPGQAAHQPGRL